MSLPQFLPAPAQEAESLVRQHAGLVRRLAHQLLAKLPPSVDLDDLIQAGMIGLLDAARHFEGGQGAQFETYAVTRVRGAMLDELRQQDWLPRRSRQKARQVQQAMQRLEQQLGHAPSGETVAEALGISIDEYHQILAECRGAQILHLEDLHDPDDDEFLDRHATSSGAGPQDILESSRFQGDLQAAITSLPERECLVLSLYYQDELNLREIGAVLDVSESRASQLLSQATLRLRANLQGWMEPGATAAKAARGRPRKIRAQPSVS